MSVSSLICVRPVFYLQLLDRGERATAGADGWMDSWSAGSTDESRLEIHRGEEGGREARLHVNQRQDQLCLGLWQLILLCLSANIPLSTPCFQAPAQRITVDSKLERREGKRCFPQIPELTRDHNTCKSSLPVLFFKLDETLLFPWKQSVLFSLNFQAN